MDRFWLLTWTTYGTWLPGCARGYVGRERLPDGSTRLHNQPGTPFLRASAPQANAARKRMRGAPVGLSMRHAEIALRAFRETCAYRRWRLLAAAVMPTHVHVVAGVPGDPDPTAILRDLKSYASRHFNAAFARPAAGWWTESGSKRKLADEVSVLTAMRYVRDQANPLVVWIDEHAFAG